MLLPPSAAGPRYCATAAHQLHKSERRTIQRISIRLNDSYLMINQHGSGGRQRLLWIPNWLIWQDAGATGIWYVIQEDVADVQQLESLWFLLCIPSVFIFPRFKHPSLRWEWMGSLGDTNQEMMGKELANWRLCEFLCVGVCFTDCYYKVASVCKWDWLKGVISNLIECDN